MLRDSYLIARRDFRAYFSSPVAYIVLSAFMALMGYFFLRAVGAFLGVSQNFMQYTQGPRPTVTEFVVQGLYETMGIILLFLMPSITMRLFAEEKRDHTLELLLAAPVDSWSIVIGKFLSALGFSALMLAVTLPYPLILLLTSQVDAGVLASCYLGLLFLVAGFIAVGLFFSAVTENQVVAFVLTMGVVLFMWVLAGAANSSGPIWSEVVNYISIFTHFNNFCTGAFDSSDIVYFFSVVLIGLFATYLTFDTSQ